MHMKQRLARTGLLLAFTVAMSGCHLPTVEGFFLFGSETDNYFDPELGAAPVLAFIGEGPEFTYDQRAVFPDPETGDFQLEVDLTLNDTRDTLTVVVRMSSTEDLNSVDGMEITLDNFSWEARGLGIADVTEDADDFPSLTGNGAQLEAVDGDLVFTWPGFLFLAPFDHEARYTVALAPEEV